MEDLNDIATWNTPFQKYLKFLYFIYGKGIMPARVGFTMPQSNPHYTQYSKCLD